LTDKAVVVEGLTKIYPRVMAVDGVSFDVDAGEIFGLLGPNGAGKTTTIRILLTLIKPTAGTIRIFGIDGLKSPEEIRRMAGYVPQDVSVDAELSGYENILMYSKLYGVPGKERRKRIEDVLSYLGLLERADSMVGTYSGGMMRRLEIAQALVNRPRILFLDEPSIGLDPGAQKAIWGLIERLRDEFGTTIFLTTHDMNEADTLCDRIGIMDKGKLVVIGRPSQLKASVGADVLTISTPTPGCAVTLKGLGYAVISESPEASCDVLVSDGETVIPRLLEDLKTAGVDVDSVALHKLTLGDVFLKYTGARMEGGGTWKDVRRTRRTFRRLTK
jgi:ABC-2 type transport system ATP-binding protein